MATSRSEPPPAAGRLTVDGHALAWEAQGDPRAPVVVLLHHGLGSRRAWRAQLPALAGAGWRALAYDRWGYGQSDPRPALDLPHFTRDRRDLEALLAALGVERAALIGHSDGGTLALEFAAALPDRVAALVVVAAHIYVEPAMIPAFADLRRRFEAEAGLRQGLRRAHGDRARQVFFNWHDGWAQPEHLAWDLRPRLAAVRCPALVVQGQDDEHASPRHAHDLAAALPQATLWLEPGAGHMLPQDQPDLFNRRALAFLEPVRALLQPAPAG